MFDGKSDSLKVRFTKIWQDLVRFIRGCASQKKLILFFCSLNYTDIQL